MTPQQVEWIKALDKEGVSGTIQGVLMRDDLQQVPQEAVLKFLLTNTLQEKELLAKENAKLYKVLKESGLSGLLNSVLFDN